MVRIHDCNELEISLDKVSGNLVCVHLQLCTRTIINILTGGAAKSIQSINVAAVVAVAAAAAVAGLASPAATHSMKKLRVWRKTALFLSLSVFLEQLSLFPMSMLALNSFSGKGGPIKLFFKNTKMVCFLLGTFW